jgi:hypothetical protein
VLSPATNATRRRRRRERPPSSRILPDRPIDLVVIHLAIDARVARRPSSSSSFAPSNPITPRLGPLASGAVEYVAVSVTACAIVTTTATPRLIDDARTIVDATARARIANECRLNDVIDERTNAAPHPSETRQSTTDDS